MRQIEKNMNRAIRTQSNWSGSNTTVFTTDDGLESTVYLHGNHIATFWHDTRQLQVKDGGWQSNTTKSRLNAILYEFFTGTRIFQKNFQWFITDYTGKNVLDFVSGRVISNEYGII